MSDYLERLVARSLDTPDAIRPRPIGLFETPGNEAVPAVTYVREEEASEPVRAAAAEPQVYPARPEAPVGRSTQPAPSALPAAEPLEPARRRHQHVRAASEPVALLVVTETPPVGRRGESPVVSAPLVRPMRLQEAQPAQRAAESRADPPPVPASVRELAPTAGRPWPRELGGDLQAEGGATVLRPRPTPPAQHAARAADLGPRSKAAVPQTAVAAPRRSIGEVTMVAAPRVERPNRDREASAAAAASPTIHVTIGRVEVRASSPPVAAVRARTAPPPVMGLDEYLKQRRRDKA